MFRKVGTFLGMTKNYNTIKGINNNTLKTKKFNDNRTYLHLASRYNKKNNVKLLLDIKNIKINNKNSKGMTALMLAAKYGYINIVNMLLNKNPDIEQKDNEGKTALIWATIGGNIDVVKCLLEKDANIHEKDKSGRKAINFARGEIKNILQKQYNDQINSIFNIARYNIARYKKEQNLNSIKKFEKLIDRYPKIIYKTDIYGRRTPLIFVALEYGNFDLIKILLEKKGVDINKKYDGDITILMSACYVNVKIDFVEYLVSKGADVNAMNDDKKTSLIMASRWGHTDVVEFLISKGANVNSKDIEGLNSLMWACKLPNSKDLVECLLRNGANIYEKDNYGDNSLIFATSKGNIDVVNLLLKEDANINKKNKLGRNVLLSNNKGNIKNNKKYVDSVGSKYMTPLILATRNNFINIVELLLKNGANSFLTSFNKDRKECNALTFAIENNNKKIVDILLEVRDEYGNTPIIRVIHDSLHFSSSYMITTILKFIKTKDYDNMRKDYLNIKNNEGINALMMMAITHQSTDLEDFIYYIDINAQDNLGNTALMHFLKSEYKCNIGGHLYNKDLHFKDPPLGFGRPSPKCNYEMVEKFFEKKDLNINLQNNDGKTAIMLAFDNNKFLIAVLLFKYGADISFSEINKKDNFGNTLLIYASYIGQIDIFKKIIEKGSNVNLQNNDGITALMILSKENFIDMTDLLCNEGANLDLQDKDGKTALMYACIFGSSGSINLLCDRGANIDLQDKDGKTALMFSIPKSYWEGFYIFMPYLLCKKGANVYLKDKDGKTFINIVKNRSHDDKYNELFEYLKKIPKKRVIPPVIPSVTSPLHNSTNLIKNGQKKANTNISPLHNPKMNNKNNY